MASVIDICNLALGHLGDDASVSSISPPEGSAQAEHCARFYPIARDAILELHDWKFATRRVALTQLDIASWEWAGAFAAPNNMLRILAVLPREAASDAGSEDFETASSDDGALIVLTNTASPSARCTFRVTDTTRYPPLFVDALSRLLASYLAGPIIKGDAGMSVSRAQYQGFMLSLAQAKVSDANQQRRTLEHTPGWISAR